MSSSTQKSDAFSEEVQIIPLNSNHSTVNLPAESSIKPEIEGPLGPAGEEERDRNNNLLRIGKAVQEYLEGIKGAGQVSIMDEVEDQQASNFSRGSDDEEITPASNFSTKAKEIWTSFSRSLNSSLYTNAYQIPVGSKLGSFLDRLSLMTEDKGFSLPNFIVAGIASNLKKLGVEELDCKEHVEAWLSQRRQRCWIQSLGRQAQALFDKNDNCTDSYSCTQCVQNLHSPDDSNSIFTEKSETPTIFSPSQPNSSLLRLTGDGDVQLGRFLTNMEEVRGHLNNATCTLLQAAVVLTLPYLKLLSGDQLDNHSCESFVNDWLQMITMMAQDVKSESMKEVDNMISVEYRNLRDESKRLHKTVKKLHKRISKIVQENEKEATPALQRLQPRRLPNFRGRRKDRDTPNNATNNTNDNNNNKCDNATAKASKNTTLPPEPEPPIIQPTLYAPVPLNRANVSDTDLFKNHVFFSKSKRGYLVFKKKIEGEWKRFGELSFTHRREIFLHVTDDLHSTLKLGSCLSGHLNELFIDGYPESIVSKMQENLKYLREVSKESTELLMLSKVTIANQVKSLQDTLTRLMKTLDNLKLVSKSFSKSIKLSQMAAKPPMSFWRKNKTAVTTISQLNSKGIPGINREYVEFDVNLSLRFDDSRVKLLVPYPSAINPFSDKLCMSALE